MAEINFTFIYFYFTSGMDNGQIVVWTNFEENLNQILIQHSLSILSLSFSPGGRFLSSLDASGKIVIWLPEVKP